MLVLREVQHARRPPVLSARLRRPNTFSQQTGSASLSLARSLSLSLSLALSLSLLRERERERERENSPFDRCVAPEKKEHTVVGSNSQARDLAQGETVGKRVQRRAAIWNSVGFLSEWLRTYLGLLDDRECSGQPSDLSRVRLMVAKSEAGDLRYESQEGISHRL